MGFVTEFSLQHNVHAHTAHRYHSARDKRIPNVYQCFDCRIRSDKNWDLIVMRDQHLVLISDFKDFVIFRSEINRVPRMFY